MRETVEFRVPEDDAVRYLPGGAGVKRGIARRLILAVDDPLFHEIGQIDRQLRVAGGGLVTGWMAIRHYSRREFEEAERFHVWPRKTFEPAGEECGTAYDDSKACPSCGGGAPQETPLLLDARRLPRSLDFAQTIAGELVVSRRAAEVFRRNGLSGGTFDPVRLSNKAGLASTEYFQLSVAGSAAEFDAATRFGEDPFDTTRYGRCPRGDLAGLNLLSEVFVKRAGAPMLDVAATRQMVGVRRGLLRPRPVLLLSPRAWRAIGEANLKGLNVEVAHLR